MVQKLGRVHKQPVLTSFQVIVSNGPNSVPHCRVTEARRGRNENSSPRWLRSTTAIPPPSKWGISTELKVCLQWNGKKYMTTTVHSMGQLRESQAINTGIPRDPHRLTQSGNGGGRNFRGSHNERVREREERVALVCLSQQD